MAVDIFVSLRVFVRPCDPTGGECNICGDTPWLDAWELCVSINSGPPDVAAYVCKDCADECREQFE